MKNRMNAELSFPKEKVWKSSVTNSSAFLNNWKKLLMPNWCSLRMYLMTFRTPLTLVAAPVEQLLEDEALTSRQRSLLQMVHKM
mgnify:CR=1 FL=1